MAALGALVSSWRACSGYRCLSSCVAVSGASTRCSASRNDAGRQGCKMVPRTTGRRLSQSEIIACLRNKRVFIGGNSVARHWAFALAEIISGATAYTSGPGLKPWQYRDEEKKRCGGAQTPGRDADCFACFTCRHACLPQSCSHFSRSHLGCLLSFWHKS